jgi:hypothetical protein
MREKTLAASDVQNRIPFLEAAKPNKTRDVWRVNPSRVPEIVPPFVALVVELFLTTPG